MVLGCIAFALAVVVAGNVWLWRCYLKLDVADLQEELLEDYDDTERKAG